MTPVLIDSPRCVCEKDVKVRPFRLFYDTQHHEKIIVLPNRNWNE